MSLISVIKGWFGEAQASLAHKLFLDSAIYISLNNVTIPTFNGTTQIDHVIVSRYGIFVVEAKNMKGWIFGDEHGRQWTQVLFGKKYKFQNPLHQNYRHTKSLSDFLSIDHNKIFSLVMFWGECEFKTPMPSNVLLKGYLSFFKSKKQVQFSEAEVQQHVIAIRAGMLPQTWGTRSQHVEDLKERFSSKTQCPKCGSALVLRTAKKGHNVGAQFYGCSKFPACRYMAHN
ncbi:MAG: NERD domain-containing protein [Glaciimonas sp.]|nr:NERD domain-containing protein [Glaciimonas sp.]